MNRFKHDIWTLYKVIFIFSFVYFIWFCSMEWDQSQDFNSHRQSERVRSISSNVSGALSSQQTAMRLIVDYLNTTNLNNHDLNNLISAYSGQDNGVSSIYIFNKENNVIISSNGNKNEYNKFKKHIIQNYDSIISGLNQKSNPLFIETSGNEKTISLVMPFTQFGGKNPSVLVFVVNSSLNGGFFDSPLNLASSNFTLTLDSSGKLLYSIHLSKDEIMISEAVNNFDKLKMQSQLKSMSSSSENSHFEFYQGKSKINNSFIFYSMIYNRDFRIWTISADSYSVIFDDFINDLIPSFVGFLILHLFFFFFVWKYNEKEKASIEKLFYQANHDYLTGLPNRYFIRARYNNWSDDNKNGTTVMLIGLDRFKNVNDVQGQIFADNMLVEVSKRLSSMNFGSSIVARENGDEFLILSSITDTDKVSDMASTIIKEIARPYYFGVTNSITMSCSIGVSIHPNNGKSVEKLIRCSAIAMDEAKKEKGKFVIFDEDMIHNHMFKAKIENRLRMALKTKSISLVYQPQVNSDGSLYGVEALVRWDDEMLGNVRPDIFIPVAEESGLIYELGKYIKHTAMSQMKTVQDMYNIDFQTSINISVKQINNVEFIENITSAASETGYPLDLLTIEITESVFAVNLNKINMKIETLRSLGLRVSLDDFGTGYSSLSMLNNISIDELKIDKSFIDNISKNERASRMVQSIITIGKNFETVILAEGIESSEHHTSLVEMGCDLFQGYFFSKPLPLDHLCLYLDEHIKNSIKA